MTTSQAGSGSSASSASLPGSTGAGWPCPRGASPPMPGARREVAPEAVAVALAAAAPPSSGSCSEVGKWLCILRRTRRSCQQ
ncbi:hypothetical protein G6F24_018447 [Rhizopus arrhizus]|nr:hypothetical protein G6F24_018447 [Rhizopus arrhizus]